MRNFLQALKTEEMQNQARSSGQPIPCGICSELMSKDHVVSFCEECRDKEVIKAGGKLKLLCQAKTTRGTRCKGSIGVGTWYCSKHTKLNK